MKAKSKKYLMCDITSVIQTEEEWKQEFEQDEDSHEEGLDTWEKWSASLFEVVFHEGKWLPVEDIE